MKEEGAAGRGLNRDVIKYIAMFTMMLNHFAVAFLNPASLSYEILTDIGYFTAITMCYFLVEGYGYTRSKRKYGGRLLLFGFLAEIPFCMTTGYVSLNMMFTLFFCFCILAVLERVPEGMMRIPLILCLILVTLVSDWALMAPVFTLMFAKWKGQKDKLRLAYGIAVLIFCGFNYLSYSMVYAPAEALGHSLAACIGVAVSGIVILEFYNGKRATRGQNFSKWFFYIFYPAHLLVFGILRLWMAA